MHLRTLIPKRELLVPSVRAEEIVAYNSLLTRADTDETTRVLLADVPEATTAANFRINIQGKPRSSWNRSAARVFARDYIEKLQMPNTFAMYQAVENTFFVHLKYLTALYRTSQKSRATQTIQNSKSRRAARKRGVICKF